jgi:hypothetical protein
VAFFLEYIECVIIFTILGCKLTNPTFMKKITFLLALFFCFGAVRAQVAAYSFSQSNEAYVPVTGNSSTAANDDGSQNLIPIGFDFNFGGTPYDSFSINVNGWIRLGGAIGGNSWINAMGNGAGAAPLIAPYWDDHNRTDGFISYHVTGTAPNRVLEVGWDNINISTGGMVNTTNYGSFKLQLHETTGVIDFVYGSMAPGGQLSASVGINDAASFLSVTPSITATTSFVTANNEISNIGLLSGKKLSFTPPEPCSAAPVPGNTLSSLSGVCLGMPFTLSLQNDVSDFGISYQWQSSANGVDFDDIVGATSPTLTIMQTASTYYQCVTSCGANSAASTPIQVLQNNPLTCYCTPTYTNGKTDGDLISNVFIDGTTLSNNTGTIPINPSYTYFSGQPNYTATLQAGITYDIAVTVGTFGQQEISVWIDYNDDAIFTENEKVGFTTTQVNGGGTGIFPIELGCDLPPGTHRMRIRDAWNTTAATMDPCTNYGYGETEDYDITVLASTGCQRPDGLSADNVSSSSAVLSWYFGCGHLSWDVHVTTHNGGLPAGEPSNPGAESGLVISSLDADTGYEFYVRAHCDGDAVSDWAGPFDFTTLPLGVSNDDCETSLALIPGVDFAQYAVVSSNVGATKTVGQPNPTCGQFNFGGDVWFSVEVPEDGNITIEVQPDPGSPVVDTALTAFSGDCFSLTALGCSDDEGVDAFSMLNLTGLTPGSTVYARVWEYANDVHGTFQVSAWNPTLKTQDFDNAHFEYYPNPVKDFLNLSYNKTITNAEVFNLLGQKVFDKAIGSNQGKIDLSQLSKGAYMVRINADNQTKMIKIIKE